MTTPQSIDPLEREVRVRSDFVRELVQGSVGVPVLPAEYLSPPPRIIVQFWDDLTKLPSDVKECMESWKQLEQFGAVKVVEHDADVTGHNTDGHVVAVLLEGALRNQARDDRSVPLA